MTSEHVDNYVDNLLFFGFVHTFQLWKTYQRFIHQENLWINVENSVLVLYIDTYCVFHYVDNFSGLSFCVYNPFFL